LRVGKVGRKSTAAGKIKDQRKLESDTEGKRQRESTAGESRRKILKGS
jgi:hypothetical protein